MSEKILKAGALFSGIGGFCLGFERSGIKTAWAVENSPHSVSTYQHNIPDVRIISDDGVPASITDISVKKHGLEPVDVLHAGFPCQNLCSLIVWPATRFVDKLLNTTIEYLG